MAAGIAGVRLLTVVRVSSSSDGCLIVSHLVCKVVIFNRKKLTLVERCRSNHCVNNRVNVFRLMQERKYVCGEQLKIRILQHSHSANPHIRGLPPTLKDPSKETYLSKEINKAYINLA